MFSRILLAATVVTVFASVRADHLYTMTNNCGAAVTPVFADTRCGYSPRCADASSYTGAQPPAIQNGQTITVTAPDDWVGRVFVQNGSCGPKGEDCTITEYNLDFDSQYTPNSYDISNIQGFTQSVSIVGDGCAEAICTNADCGCTNAYPVGDTSGCGNDSPVKGCGPGAIGFHLVFCP